MRCPSCNHMMLNTSCLEIQDDTGALTITRWHCRPCHETAEEIWVSAGYRGPNPISVRYAVDDQRQPKISTRSRGGSKRGSLAHAVPC